MKWKRRLSADDVTTMTIKAEETVVVVVVVVEGLVLD
jgi:hypothetical protein